MDQTAVALEGIQKSYKLYENSIFKLLADILLPGRSLESKSFHALKNINLKVKKGEILGIVGKNGSGKTTLLKIIAGISQETAGTKRISGNVVPLLELGGGFNSDYTGRENIYLNCSLLGLSKKETEARIEEIIKFSELDDFIDVPIKKYSSGMKARLGFSISINIDPDILILDEVLSVGDALFKRKCFVKMQEFFTSGKTILFVSHNAKSVLNICKRAILLHKGEILVDGEPEFVMNQYSRLLNSGKGKEDDIASKIKSMSEPKAKGIGKQPKAVEIGSTLVNKSRKIVKHVNVDFLHNSLCDEFGVENHFLGWGKPFDLQFDLGIKEDINVCKIGVLLHDSQSKKVTECFYPLGMDNWMDIESGQRISFSSRFHSYLKPGLYGITLIIKSIKSGKVRNIYKIIDAVLFKVIDQTNSNDSTIQLFENNPHLEIE